MYRTLNEIKEILWSWLNNKKDTNQLLDIVNKCNIEFQENLESNYCVTTYGNNTNKFSYPAGIRTFELINSKNKRMIGNIINMYNNQTYCTIIFSTLGNLLIFKKKHTDDIYINGVFTGRLINKKNIITVCNEQGDFAKIKFPKWWQFKRLGEVNINNCIIKFDILSPHDSVIKAKIPTHSDVDLYLIIAAIFNRTTKSLTV